MTYRTRLLLTASERLMRAAAGASARHARRQMESAVAHARAGLEQRAGLKPGTLVKAPT